MDAAIYFNDQFLLKAKKIYNKKSILTFYFKFNRMLPDEFLCKKPSIT